MDIDLGYEEKDAINSILFVKDRPILSDITSLDNWNISPEDIEKIYRALG